MLVGVNQWPLFDEGAGYESLSNVSRIGVGHVL